jgi:hypothetical protein
MTRLRRLHFSALSGPVFIGFIGYRIQEDRPV